MTDRTGGTHIVKILDIQDWSIINLERGGQQRDAQAVDVYIVQIADITEGNVGVYNVDTYNGTKVYGS